MQYNAHKIDDSHTQTIENHLNGVSTLAEDFSVGMFKSICYEIANAHDIGKYAKDFQDRLDNDKIKYEHSLGGAIEYGKIMSDGANQIIRPLVEFCIACHHTGLQDGSRLEERISEGSDYYVGSRDYSVYKDYVQLKAPDISEIFKELKSAKNNEDIIELYSFFVRYVFSCLTDADFLDTEMFYKPDIDRTLKNDFAKASRLLESTLDLFVEDTPVKSARNSLQKQAFENSKISSNIGILNMPTGSGKTLCSMKIALNKVLNSEDKKRIIYVIPYNSIIEQTAETFNRIFGDSVDILQHHSNYTFESSSSQDDTEKSTIEKLKLACENWDAPIVITTSVQFFQSLYHYKSSKLRKLHNLANSIIIFDEIHMLPVEYIQPCLRAIGYVTKYLNSEAIFLSATMPNYNELFSRYLPNATINSLIADKSNFHYFKNCKYVNIGITSFESVILKADKYQSSLIILNTRKSVREVYDKLVGNKYHISTYMTPFDRSNTIKSIKEDLSNGKKIVVVATSLVEAGVDFDFQAVFREVAGLDSILQSGGRCNREGKRDDSCVYVFESDVPKRLQNDMSARIEITKRLLKDYKDITSIECIEDYYNTLFKFKNDSIDSNSMYKFVNRKSVTPYQIEFKSYAESFNLIKDDTISLVIKNNAQACQLVDDLYKGDFSTKRKLQRYSVNLKFIEFAQALQLGLVEDTKMGVFVLSNNAYYRSEIGLDLDYDDSIFI